MPTVNKKKFLATLSGWVVDEVLSIYPNKSDFVQEAILKLHMEKVNKGNARSSTIPP